jgi:murein DD-endopeptidase MepM/ murein hydrolase activator NlpD
MKKLTKIIVSAALAACFSSAMAGEPPMVTPMAATTPAVSAPAVPVPAAAPTPVDAVEKNEKKGFFARWVMPLQNIRVSSFFGALRGKRAHGGVDFSTPVNTPVMATQGGVVVASTNRYDGDKKYGEVVVIEHLNGLRSLYAHLNKRSVNVGDEVAAGQPIGFSGSTGHSTGPHLHLEAFQNGKRIDPQNMLAGLEEGALQSAVSAKQFTGQEMIFTAPKTSTSLYKRAKSTPERTKTAASTGSSKRTKAKSSTAPARKTASHSTKKH